MSRLWSFRGRIGGTCTILVEADTMNKAVERALERYWDDIVDIEWEVESIDYDSVEERG